MARTWDQGPETRTRNQGCTTSGLCKGVRGKFFGRTVCTLKPQIIVEGGISVGGTVLGGLEMGWNKRPRADKKAVFSQVNPPGPIGTDRSRKMMQIAPTDAPKSWFGNQNRLRNIFGHLGGNLAPEAQTIFFRDHVASWTGGTHKLSVSGQRS